MFYLYLQNQAQVATSLQVFHNLGSLREIVDKVVNLCRDNLEADIKSCLDVTALSKQQTGPQGKGTLVLLLFLSVSPTRWYIMLPLLMPEIIYGEASEVFLHQLSWKVAI